MQSNIDGDISVLFHSADTHKMTALQASIKT